MTKMNGDSFKNKIYSLENEVRSLREANEYETMLRQQVADIQAVGNQLAMTESFDDLCKEGVALAKEHLKFDRMSFWFVVSESPLEVRGAYGVNEDGVVRDERDQLLGLSENCQMGRVLVSEKKLLIEKDTSLHDEKGRVVGHGEHAICPLWDGKRVIGCVSVDNLCSCLSITPALQHLLELFASTLGHLASRKRAEDELKKYEEKLFQTQRVEFVGHMANGIAHDLNNLLSPIHCFTELAFAKLPPKHPSADDLKQVLAATDRAKALAFNLLAISRRKKLDVSKVDLNQVVTDFERILRQLLLKSDVELFIHTISTPIMLDIDLSQIEQVLMNLTINARDAMPTGGDLKIFTMTSHVENARSCSCGGVYEGDYGVLKVMDTGDGIPESLKKRIFEPFYSTKAEDKGTGLGLSTIRSIVEQYKGAIDLESSVGDGTLFTIYLPLSKRVRKTS